MLSTPKHYLLTCSPWRRLSLAGVQHKALLLPDASAGVHRSMLCRKQACLHIRLARGADWAHDGAVFCQMKLQFVGVCFRLCMLGVALAAWGDAVMPSKHAHLQHLGIFHIVQRYSALPGLPDRSRAQEKLAASPCCRYRCQGMPVIEACC